MSWWFVELKSGETKNVFQSRHKHSTHPYISLSKDKSCEKWMENMNFPGFVSACTESRLMEKVEK